MFSSSTTARAVIYVGIVGLLSLPALGGLLQGILMRGFLGRSTLWGALTGGGIVLASTGVIVTLTSLHELSWPMQYRVAAFAAERFGLVRPPIMFVGVILTSVLFGLILGTVQAVALVPRWSSMSAWLAASIAAAVLTGLWLYAWANIEPFEALFAQSAE